MWKEKFVYSPFAGHFKLNSWNCPTSKKEKQEMRKVLYASTIGSLMQAMVCTRPDMAYAVKAVN